MGQALLTPIRDLINTIEMEMDHLLGTLGTYFKKAIEELLSALSEVGEQVAAALKKAMLEILESCVTGLVPSCLIGPPGGCGDPPVRELSWVGVQANAAHGESLPQLLRVRSHVGIAPFCGRW